MIEAINHRWESTRPLRTILSLAFFLTSFDIWVTYPGPPRIEPIPVTSPKPPERPELDPAFSADGALRRLGTPGRSTPPDLTDAILTLIREQRQQGSPLNLTRNR